MTHCKKKKDLRKTRYVKPLNYISHDCVHHSGVTDSEVAFMMFGSVFGAIQHPVISMIR